MTSKTGKDKYGDFVIKQGKMLFNRVGSPNAQSQKNKKAPEKRGVWAFPYPLFEWFFVGADYSMPSQHNPHPQKIIDLTEKEIKQLGIILKRMQRQHALELEQNDNKLYRCTNTPYEMGSIKFAIEEGAMFGYDYSSIFKKSTYRLFNRLRKFYWGGPIYARFSPKQLDYIDDTGWHRYDNIYDYVKELRKQLLYFTNEKFHGGPDKFVKYGVDIVGNRKWNCSKDHLEVFIPMKG